MNKILFKSFFVFLFLFFFSACTSSYNMSVYLSPELKDYYGYYPSLEVDIVGLNENEKNWMSSYNMNKYFEANNPMRKSLMPHTLKFSQSNGAAEQDFNDNAKEWNLWKKKGAVELLVAVNLPGVDDSVKKVTKDIKSYIGKRKHIYIEIRPVGITFLDSKPTYNQ